jgi:hypothetical protein
VVRAPQFWWRLFYRLAEPLIDVIAIAITFDSATIIPPTRPERASFEVFAIQVVVLHVVSEIVWFHNVPGHANKAGAGLIWIMVIRRCRTTAVNDFVDASPFMTPVTCNN